MIFKAPVTRRIHRLLVTLVVVDVVVFAVVVDLTLTNLALELLLPPPRFQNEANLEKHEKETFSCMQTIGPLKHNTANRSAWETANLDANRRRLIARIDRPIRTRFEA